MANRSELSAAQRHEAVLALLRREAAAAVLARRFGIAEQTLYHWRDEFLVERCNILSYYNRHSKGCRGAMKPLSRFLVL